MTYTFETGLSEKAKGTATPFNGYPTHHFVGGNIDEPTVPVEHFAEIIADIIRTKGHAMAKYGMESGPQGYLPLRQFICECTERHAGMQITPDQVLLTSGSLQAMDLVNAAFLNPGDTVVLEAGNYAGALTRLDALGVTYVGVELDEHGMRMDALEQTLSDLKAKGIAPKFIYTIPTIQNPTGSVMPENRRHEFLELAKRFDTPIFEDDCYADLTFDGARPKALHALDQEGRVIYCATFSKTIAPALRVGYLIAPWPLMGHILPLKTDAGSGALEQMMLAEYLPNHFDAHVDRLRPMLKEKAETLTAALDEHFGTSVTYSPPVGGIYLWVTLPEHVDTNRLYQLALKEGIEINPGAAWTVNGDENKHRMRICFGHPSNENIKEGIAKLADICFEEFGVPVRSGNVNR